MSLNIWVILVRDCNILRVCFLKIQDYGQNMMWKVWLIKFLYYIFFGIIFLIAVIIFLEIMDFGFYKDFFGDFIYKVINKLNF